MTPGIFKEGIVDEDHDPDNMEEEEEEEDVYDVQRVLDNTDALQVSEQ